MLEIELIQLVEKIQKEKCEKPSLELKKAYGGTPQKLYDTLSSFSNQSGGGTIVFGIDESADYEVVGVYDPQDLQKKICEQAEQMEPIVRPLFTIAEIQGKIVVSAEIAECDIFNKPCYYKGSGKWKGSYIRVGDGDQLMTEYEIYSFEAFKRRIHDEQRIVERSTRNHLKKDNITEYLLKVRRLKPNLIHMEDDRILETQGIIKNGQPTLTGLFLFGEYPQEFFPQLSITAVVVQGKEYGDLGDEGERFTDNQRIEGTISQMLEGSLNFVRRNMKTSTIISERGFRQDKTEYPVKAVREILLNALIHRDYSVHTESSPIRLVIYEDRLELENPGGLYGRLTLDSLGRVAADTRNPYLAGALEVMMDTENRFSGIPTIRAELKKAGMPEPVFYNHRGVFKVAFYKGIKESIHESTLTFQLLEFCKTPRSREELAERFNFSSIPYFIKTYVDPLIDQGLIQRTIQDKPRSKNQKFVTIQ
ncbi:putative DNA binding domain-containing protein [Proteiniclasticum sp. BAD-10]|uniref:DNA binding domain-containing protein n=1 Tax=Proteiniclasticum sediminis TaxID=2804028 RepID=A0A941CLW1_9CLOT|nr:ATP-binding protein [Proteiniclasticum sediminis]MBR0575056.1 putative DNA binding domain-containing protein [Proteiniclasticum sediminis]